MASQSPPAAVQASRPAPNMPPRSMASAPAVAGSNHKPAPIDPLFD